MNITATSEIAVSRTVATGSTVLLIGNFSRGRTNGTVGAAGCDRGVGAG
jgi:hypothetical protein